VRTVQHERTAEERERAAQERAARRAARAGKPARGLTRQGADAAAPGSSAYRDAVQAVSRAASLICGFGGRGMPAALRDRRAVLAAAAVLVLAGVVVAFTRDGSKSSSKRVSATAGSDGGTPAQAAKPAPLPELPGGGRRIFPDRRVVAFYGNPTAAALGVLGIGKPSTMVDKLRRQAKPYARKTRPILPALELISSIAANAPGNDGRYINHVPAKIINRYLRAARKAKAILVLDIQPGHADFMSETRRLRRWLKEPDVGLALDPEWHTPGVVPGTQLGSTSAADVNRVTRYLAQIVRERQLPQKLLIIHQFTQGMVRNKSQLQTPPEVAVTMNVDGFGTRSGKLSKYKDFTRKPNRPPGTHVGFKLFYQEDTNLYTPKSVMALKPRPDLVIYE
jgi:hypothetical protein